MGATVGLEDVGDSVSIARLALGQTATTISIGTRNGTLAERREGEQHHKRQQLDRCGEAVMVLRSSRPASRVS